MLGWGDGALFRKFYIVKDYQFIMTETVNMNKIYETLIELKREVNFIKNHMVDVDVILTPEENIELDESLKELEEGKTFSLEDIKKDREDA